MPAEPAEQRYLAARNVVAAFVHESIVDEAPIGAGRHALRVEYFERVYDTGWLLPCTYDLCINTDHLNSGQAAELVAQVAALR